jgi:putative DNA primase/helicase
VFLSSYAELTLLNSIISGETVTVERKYHHPYEINPTVKLLWAMNDPPRISDPNNGIFRRVHIVRVPALDDADKDETLKDRIKLEGPGILNWALDGLERLTRRGHFCKPLSVAQSSRQYQAHADVPGVFLSECCERNPAPLDFDNPDYREQSSELYRAYTTWAKENGHRPVSSTRIADDWERLGLEKKRITGCTYWCGVRLIDFRPFGKP